MQIQPEKRVVVEDSQNIVVICGKVTFMENGILTLFYFLYSYSETFHSLFNQLTVFPYYCFLIL